MEYIYSLDRSAGSASSVMSLFGTFAIVPLVIGVFFLICTWKVFKKAGQAGWKSLIPIYSNIVLLNISGLSGWYFLLNFVPFANIYILFKQNIELAHKFGKSTGFGIGMVFFNFICLPILAFGNCEYEGSTNKTQQVYNQEPIYQQPTSFDNQNNVVFNNTTSTKKMCPYCREQVNTNDKFCIKCGGQF